jgi:hypothetical protein
MARSKELFTPDSIDDDIDSLLDESHSIFPDLNSQFIRELRSISQEDAASLKQVWERLEHYSRLQYAFQEPSLQTPQRLVDNCHITPFQSWRQSKPRNSARPLFTVLAAALVGFFLVGSLASILAMRHPATPAAPRQVTISSVSSVSLSHFVTLTIHNDKSDVNNYFTLTYIGADGQTKQHIVCQPIPPLNWIDVLSPSGTPVQILAGQTVWLRYFHSNQCNPSSMFLSVTLPIPAMPVNPHCWFNPDNTTTPNWSGCVNPSQTLPIGLK